MDLHDHTDFGAYIPYLGSEGFFCLFDPFKYTIPKLFV
jgi:hypothetical protein